MDAAMKLRTEQATHRQAIRARNAVHILLTAYMLYYQDKFPEMKAVDRSAKSADIIRQVAKQWQELSGSEKQVLSARLLSMQAARALELPKPAVSP